jgi:prepilin-type N-terminal cleavage/methylation domain-containing protein
VSQRRTESTQPAPERALAGALAVSRRRTGRRGFTLLEVLAAVALIGFAYVALSQAGIQGLRIEGDARRRLEASLLADRTLADLEAAVETGSVPAPGTDEREEDEYVVATEVAPYSLTIPAPKPKTGEERTTTPAPEEGGLLGSTKPGSSSALRRITVRVSWPEGDGERAVERTTFAFDAESVRSELDKLDAAAEAAAQAAQGRSNASGTPPAGNNP